MMAQNVISPAGMHAVASYASQDAELLQGDRSVELQDAIGIVYDRWVLAARPIVTRPATDEVMSADEPEYVPIPPKRTFIFQVRMKMLGRGKPMHYEVQNEVRE